MGFIYIRKIILGELNEKEISISIYNPFSDRIIRIFYHKNEFKKREFKNE